MRFVLPFTDCEELLVILVIFLLVVLNFFLVLFVFLFCFFSLLGLGLRAAALQRLLVGNLVSVIPANADKVRLKQLNSRLLFDFYWGEILRHS